MLTDVEVPVKECEWPELPPVLLLNVFVPDSREEPVTAYPAPESYIDVSDVCVWLGIWLNKRGNKNESNHNSR